MNSLLKKYHLLLGDNDREFLRRVYATSNEVYVDRLRAIGFEGKSKVLDAGCGFGQWTMALAELNDSVYGIDLATDRLIIAQDVAKEKALNNVTFRQSTLEKIPFENERFDAVFCYGALFLTDIKKALTQIHRILKGGGIFYCTLNGLGWYINLWKNKPNEAANYNPKLSAAKAFSNTIEFEERHVKRDGPLIVEPEEARSLLHAAGFSDIVFEREGGISVIPARVNEVISFFQAEYYSQTGVYELLASKNAI